MKRRVEVAVVNGQVPRKVTSLAAVEPQPVLREGAALAKEIVDDQLRKIELQLRSTKALDPDQVRTVKDMVTVLVELKKIERTDRLEDKLSKVKGKTKDELLQIIGAKIIGDDE